MEPSRVQELLLAAALRERAMQVMRSKMPAGLDESQKREWRHSNWLEALEVAYSDFMDIASWASKREASPGPLNRPPAAPATP